MPEPSPGQPVAVHTRSGLQRIRTPGVTSPNFLIERPVFGLGILWGLPKSRIFMQIVALMFIFLCRQHNNSQQILKSARDPHTEEPPGRPSFTMEAGHWDGGSKCSHHGGKWGGAGEASRSIKLLLPEAVELGSRSQEGPMGEPRNAGGGAVGRGYEPGRPVRDVGRASRPRP